MQINKYAGRSYLDPTYYPVMPWIISSYEFKEFNYRDLSKTLGALVLFSFILGNLAKKTVLFCQNVSF
jgi:hypothetical protein